jgi:hypothetical protein
MAAAFSYHEVYIEEISLAVRTATGAVRSTALVGAAPHRSPAAASNAISRPTYSNGGCSPALFGFNETSIDSQVFSVTRSGLATAVGTAAATLTVSFVSTGQTVFSEEGGCT